MNWKHIKKKVIENGIINFNNYEIGVNTTKTLPTWKTLNLIIFYKTNKLK